MSGLPKVLIVDYEPRSLKSLRDLFTQSGYVVEIARDGLLALTMFKEYQPDIVLLEAMIPKKHGFEVCQEIKKSPEGKETPVIILTAAYKGRKHRSQAMHVHGCDEFIEKPCSPESILEIVKRFVPPGDVALAQAVGENASSGGQSAERLGEIIPFPAGRTSYTLPDMDEDAEREIMSKLDEILPDTPMFDERGTAGDFEMASDASGGLVDFDLDTEIGGSDSYEKPAEGPKLGIDPPAAAKTQSKRPALAMQAEEVEKLTRQRRRPQQAVEKKPFMSKTSIVIIVVASVLTLILYLAGRV